jgi:CDP-diacylglycerol---glycerol-3-phosphate 3-phosphatidyltransferase
VNPDSRSADGELDAREQGETTTRGAAFGRCLEAAIGLALLTALGAAGIAVAWPSARSVAFAGWVAPALIVVVVATGVAIERTTRSEGAEPLTVASWITLTRGAALAALVGVLGVGVDGGLVAWLPALLFAAVGLLDAVDGAVARSIDSVTDLGARLDAEIDGLATLVGSIAVVATGAAPVAFLTVGAARYLYVGSLWWRRRLDRPVRDLPPSRIRAPLSVSVLVVIWIGLTPIGGERQVTLLATIVAIPFLCNFLWDWLTVTARVSR